MRVCSAQFSNVSLEFRERGIFDSRAKYTFMPTRLLRPSDRDRNWEKCRSLCGSLFEMSVEGTRHEAYVEKRRTFKVGR